MSLPLYIRIPLGLVCIAHGVAHLVATAHLWSMLDDTSSFQPTFTAPNTGTAGMVVGGLWTLTCFAFIAIGLLVIFRSPPTMLFVATLIVSTALCLTAWPAAHVGIGFNIALAVALPVAVAWGQR